MTLISEPVYIYLYTQRNGNPRLLRARERDRDESKVYSCERERGAVFDEVPKDDEATIRAAALEEFYAPIKREKAT